MHLAGRAFDQVGDDDPYPALRRAPDFAHFRAVADAVADALLERLGDPVNPADRLEHRRLLVELVLEPEVFAEPGFDDRLEIQRVAQLARDACPPPADRRRRIAAALGRERLRPDCGPRRVCKRGPGDKARRRHAGIR